MWAKVRTSMGRGDSSPRSGQRSALRVVTVRFADIHAVVFESGWKNVACYKESGETPFSQSGNRPLRSGDVLVGIEGVEVSTLPFRDCLAVLRAATARGRRPALSFVSAAAHHQRRAKGAAAIGLAEAEEEAGAEEEEAREAEDELEREEALEVEQTDQDRIFCGAVAAALSASAFLTAHATASAAGLLAPSQDKAQVQLARALASLYLTQPEFALERLLHPLEPEHVTTASQVLLEALDRIPGTMLSSRERKQLAEAGGDGEALAAVVRDIGPARQACLLQLLALITRLLQRFEGQLDAVEVAGGLSRYVMAKPKAAVLAALIDHCESHLLPVPMLLGVVEAAVGWLEQHAGPDLLAGPVRSRGACAELRSALLTLEGAELLAALEPHPSHHVASTVVHLLADDPYPLLPACVVPELLMLWDTKDAVTRLAGLRAVLHSTPPSSRALAGRFAALLHACGTADEQLARQLSHVLVYSPDRARRTGGLERAHSSSGFVQVDSPYRAGVIDSIATALIAHSRYLFAPLRPLHLPAFGELHAAMAPS